MNRPLVAIMLLCSTSPALADVNPDMGDSACGEAISETLLAETPRAFRAKILKACKAAFADRTWRSHTERCDRQANKLPKDHRVAASYTCAWAMELAYENADPRRRRRSQPASDYLNPMPDSAMDIGFFGLRQCINVFLS
ncbi:hypothetical protein [Sinorhizobium medicae]|uniref:hypothetical protein n=1 Tax=Sinorhizobium medicae TaxID=110321 RepID=UPI0015D23D50|nr:hypothetical protein [Sinorhizobium medicae]